MRQLVLLFLLTYLLVSCGGDDRSGAAEATAGVATAVFGEELFNERVVGSNPGCVTCHSLEAGVTLVGPSLAGIEGRAGSTVPGLSAADYVRQSITDPDELQPALKRAMDSKKPAVIDVKIREETAPMTELLISVSL